MREIAAIGEGLLELHDDGSGRPRLGYGGDVINTAVYAARLGGSVGIVTALGDDHYSRWLKDAWAAESVDCRLVRDVPGKSPGLYIIRNGPRGERHFHYWRSGSPYGRLLGDPLFRRRLERELAHARMIFVSGISLAVTATEYREDLLTLIASCRHPRLLVATDPNYRSRLWPDREVGRQWIDRLYEHTDIALPSLDDHRALYDDRTGDAVIDRLRQRGVNEVIVKCGADGYCLAIGDARERGCAERVERPLDTTAAGDAFNAAYITARLRGSAPGIAARRGAALAARVVEHPGAIAPRKAMPL